MLPIVEFLDAKEKAEDEISAEDLSNIKEAIESLGKTDEKDSKDVIGNIKKELQDYEEDVSELKAFKVGGSFFKFSFKNKY